MSVAGAKHLGVRFPGTASGMGDRSALFPSGIAGGMAALLQSGAGALHSKALRARRKARARHRKYRIGAIIRA